MFFAAGGVCCCAAPSVWPCLRIRANRCEVTARVSSALLLRPSPSFCRFSQELLAKQSEWAFNIFDLERLVPGDAMALLCMSILLEREIPGRFGFGEAQLWDFLVAVQKSMRPRDKVKFHNATHVADVLQTMHCFLGNGLTEWLTELEVRWRSPPDLAPGRYQNGSGRRLHI